MQARPVMIGCQRKAGHHGPQIGPANADIDHIADRLARRPRNRARTHTVDKSKQSGQFAMHIADHIMPVEHDRGRGRLPQGGMQHRAVFGIVDALCGKHVIAQFLDTGCARQSQQFGPYLPGDGGLGIIDQQIIAAHRELREPVGMQGEQVFHFNGMMALAGMGQSLPMGLDLMSGHERVSCNRD